MSFDRTIDVVQKHSLGIEGAKERLRKMAEEQRGKNPHVTYTDFAFHIATNTAELDLVAYGKKVHVVVGIEPNEVTVHSTDIEGWFLLVAGGVMEAEREIGNMLSEALK